jgi:hypothetical protein
LAHDLNQRHRATAVFVIVSDHQHPALARRIQRLVQRQVNDLLPCRPIAKNQRGVGFGRLALAELVL